MSDEGRYVILRRRNGDTNAQPEVVVFTNSTRWADERVLELRRLRDDYWYWRALGGRHVKA